MIVVNLFAGAGAGKSTGATYIFSQLKMRGINCEYVPEYAKDKTWEGNMLALDCQEYVFGKQSYRLSRLKGKIDVVITDSPLPLSLIYNKTLPENEFKSVVDSVFNGYENMNYFIKRVKPYNPSGRNQTEDEAKQFDKKVRNFLDDSYSYIEVSGNKKGYNYILKDVIRKMKSNKYKKIF